MIKKAKELIRSKTARDTMYLLGGTVVSNGFGFAVIAILTRSLNPVGFGLFITALTFAQMLADFSELGVNPGSLNYIAKSEGENRKQLLKNSFLLKFTATGVVVLFVFIFSKQFAEIIFKNETIMPFIQISAFGAFLLAFVAWSQNIFQSESRFLTSALINSSTNVLRFLVIGLLLIMGFLSPILSYGAFQFILILAVIIFFVAHKLDFLKSPISKTQIKEIMRFGLPIGLSFSLSSIYTRLDQILVFNMMGSSEAGLYGLASRLILVLIFVVSAFSSAITPRYAQISKDNFGDYFKKSLYISGLLVLMVIVTALIAPFFVPVIFGDNFRSSILVFQILAIGIVPFIASIPLNLYLIFRHQKNIFIFIIGAFSLVLTWLLLNILIPIYGINGAAASVALVNFFQLFAYLIYFYYLNKFK